MLQKTMNAEEKTMNAEASKVDPAEALVSTVVQSCSPPVLFQNASKYGPAFLVAVYKSAHATCAYFSARVEYDYAAYVEMYTWNMLCRSSIYCKYTCSD